MPAQIKELIDSLRSPEFESGDLGEKYEEFRRLTLSKQRSVIAALTALLYVICAGLDAAIAPEGLKAQMLFVHLLLMPSVLVVTGALLYWPRYYRYGTFALVVAPIIASVGNVVLVSQMPEPEIWYTEIYLILFWIFTVSRLRLSHALVSAVGVSIVVSGATFLHFEGSSVALVMHFFWMSAAFIFGIASCSFLERSNRTVFSYTVQLEQMAATDKLTGLHNRSKIDEILQREIARSTRHGPAFGIVLLDIDLFKGINDKFGHLVGDAVLIQIARHLSGSIRQTDMVARWGGEEFLLIFMGATGEALEGLAEKLRLSLSEAVFEKVGTVTASFGVTSFREGDSSASLLHRADEALYLAKHQGRNCVVVRDGTVGEERSPIPRNSQLLMAPGA